MKGLDHQKHGVHFKRKSQRSSLLLFAVGVGFFMGSYLFSMGTVGMFETTKPIVIKVAGDDFSNLRWINTSFKAGKADRSPAGLAALKAEDSVGIIVSFKNSNCDFSETKKEMAALIAKTKAEHVLVALADPIQAVQDCKFHNEEVAAMKFWEVVGHVKIITGKRVHGGIIQNEKFLEDEEMVLALINLYRETGEREGHAIRYVGLKGFDRKSDPNWADGHTLVKRFFGQNSIVVQGLES